MDVACLLCADRAIAGRLPGSMSRHRRRPDRSRGDVSALIARIVAACALHYGVTILVAAALCAGAFTYAASHIAIDTDTTRLISVEVPWRQRELAFDAAFPQRADLIAVVVDATTAELAERATARL